MNLRISNWIRHGFFCLVPLLVLLVAGCGSYDPYAPNLNGGNPGATNSKPADQGFDVSHLHVGDTVTVTLEGIPDDTVAPHEESIKEDGTISLKDIGKVPAAGKTLGELQNYILNAYVPAIYTHLTVTVKFTSERVYYVRGEVKAPGQQLYRESTTVTRAITTAGDFTDFANHKKVILTRANGQRIKVNCDDVLNGDAVDPAVYPGDQIQVARKLW